MFAAPINKPPSGAAMDVTLTALAVSLGAASSVDERVLAKAAINTLTSLQKPQSRTQRATKPLQASDRSISPSSPGTLTSLTKKGRYALSIASSPIHAIPPSTRRTRIKHDIWEKLALLNSQREAERLRNETKAEVERKLLTSAALDEHLKIRARLRAEERHRDEDFDESIRLQTLQYEAELRHKQAQKAAMVAETMKEAEIANKRLMERRQQQVEKERMFDQAMLNRLEEVRKLDVARQKRLRSEHEEEVRLQRIENDRLTREKQRLAEQERLNDEKLLRDAEAAAQARERAREEAAREREAAIQRKLDAMAGVYKAKDEAERLAQEKAERETKLYWEKRDAAERTREISTRKLQADIGASVEQQLKLHEEARRREYEHARAEAEAVRAAARAHALAEKARKAALEDRMDKYRRELEVQIINDIHNKTAADETELDYKLNKDLLKGLKHDVKPRRPRA